MAKTIDTAQQKSNELAEKVAFDPISAMHSWGLRSHHLYLAGAVSVGLSAVGWLTSMLKPGDDKAQADRVGLFIGEWAPTMFAVGIALKQYEREQAGR